MYSKALFLNVHLYGVMIAAGLLCCFGVLFFYTKKKGFNEKFVDFIFYDGIASILVGFLGAALFQAFYNYLKNPEGGFDITSGLTFIGGLIGGVVCFLTVYFVFFKMKKLTGNIFDLLPIATCCILVAHGFGRLGCFFAGCCYGKPTDSFLGVRFPVNSLYSGYDGSPVHPTQLYEAAFLFLSFALFSLLYLKKNDNYIMSYYLVSYGVFRFLIEYVRGDVAERGKFIGHLFPSQFWSIIMIVIGITLFFFIRRHYKKFGFLSGNLNENEKV